MKCKVLFALSIVVVLGCGDGGEFPQLAPQNAKADPENVQADDPAEVTHNEAPRKAIAHGSDTSDYFHCFESGDCAAPSLSGSTICQNGRDYETKIHEQTSDVVVLSIHGGHIEPYSTEVAEALAAQFHFSLYSFSAHGSSGCLSGMDNFSRMHITAPHFDDPAAVDLVSHHPKALAIHGYNNNRGNNRGTICVGGANATQVATFIDYVQGHRDTFSKYHLQPVDAGSATATSGADCSGLEGTSAKNIVNRVSGGKGGLQLEMNDGIKADLINSDATYDALRSIMYGAVGAAMSQ